MSGGMSGGGLTLETGLTLFGLHLLNVSTSHVSPLFAVGENFLYVFKPGLPGPDALPSSPPRSRSQAPSRAPGGWRVKRWPGL